MGIVANANCGKMPATFFEMLASCIMVNDAGEKFINVACVDNSCDEVEPAIHCSDDFTDPEAYVVANAFTVDVCGYPALRLRLCETNGEPQ